MGQQLARYFAAVMGLALGAVWLFGGFASALTCLFAAGVCFGMTAVSQRGVLGRVEESARRHRPVLEVARSDTARARRPPHRTAGRPKQARPRTVAASPSLNDRQLESKELASAVEYGW